MSEEAPVQFEFKDVSEEVLRSLQDRILTSVVPSHGDGITNAWRTYFICETFAVTELNLTVVFPFEAILNCQEQDKILAAIHLAKLQFLFNETCRSLGYIDHEYADYFSCFLHHMIRLMTHHLTFVKKGKPTPPIGFH